MANKTLLFMLQGYTINAQEPAKEAAPEEKPEEPLPVNLEETEKPNVMEDKSQVFANHINIYNKLSGGMKI